MNDSTISTAICAHMNGHSSRTIRVSGTLATTDVTNKSPPTGGVIMPIVRFTITTMPN